MDDGSTLAYREATAGTSRQERLHDVLMIGGLFAVGQVAVVSMFDGGSTETLTCASPVLALAGSLVILGVFVERLVSEHRLLAQRFNQPPLPATTPVATGRR
jgi:hypothetical protein